MHIRNVGFLRYWTLPNLPLFLMAAPMLWLLLQSSVTLIRTSTQQPSEKPYRSHTSGKETSCPTARDTFQLPQLVLPQLVLAIAATSSFHVQIVNRISSGYPMWYITVAQWLTAQHSVQNTDKKATTSQLVIRGMVMYSIVQGVLFAGFLPPA
jgi:phosphatidylinositol glycan class V